MEIQKVIPDITTDVLAYCQKIKDTETGEYIGYGLYFSKVEWRNNFHTYSGKALGQPYWCTVSLAVKKMFTPTSWYVPGYTELIEGPPPLPNYLKRWGFDSSKIHGEQPVTVYVIQRARKIFYSLEEAKTFANSQDEPKLYPIEVHVGIGRDVGTSWMIQKKKAAALKRFNELEKRFLGLHGGPPETETYLRKALEDAMRHASFIEDTWRLLKLDERGPVSTWPLDGYEWFIEKTRHKLLTRLNSEERGLLGLNR